MYYIDIHNHMLNGVDDGSRNPETTAKMLQLAYNDGIRGIICTPHYLPGVYTTGKAERVIRVKHLEAIAKKFFPGLSLYEGCEYFASSGHFTEDLEKGRAGTLADSKYVLAEFSPATPEDVIEHRLMEIIGTGCWPILAHAERYMAFENEAFRLRVSGFAYIQINAESMLGEAGTGIKRLARKMLSEGIVTFVATDAHGAHHRKPVLSECALYLEEHFGTEYMETLLYYNPKSILDNIKL
ncbi:MAG: hypothetical protein J5738_07445 [Lachnospiraceae bacterium]|nr:hypothetical protein [Lachnospiraceae bacterium]MBO4669452.1 hypothetical protein [Lachnospiraceae bacterium]